jgi:hypothetical protein
LVAGEGLGKFSGVPDIGRGAHDACLGDGPVATVKTCIGGLAMRLLKLGVPAAVVLFAVALIAAASASASPEWFECAAVSGTGAWKDEACSEADATKKSNSERVSILPANFTSTSSVTTKLEISTNVVSCKTDTTSGEIEAPKKLTKVSMILKECKGEETTSKKTCEVKSTSPSGGKEEIVMKPLKGELGKVSKTEAASEVGVLLVPESGSVWAEVEGSCFSPVTKATLEGGLIGQYTPAGKAQTAEELVYSISGKQKIQKFEGGEQKVLKVTVLGIGVEVQVESVGKTTFELAEIGAGEQVAARQPVTYVWKYNKGNTLVAGGKKTIIETKGGATELFMLGKVGGTGWEVRCTSLKQNTSQPAQIVGGAAGKIELTWRLTGCSLPQPANCALKSTTIETSLIGLLGAGLGRSAGKVVLDFFPKGVTAPFIEFEGVNSGGACGIGKIEVRGGLLAEALDPKEELFYQEFWFEPRVARTYATLNTNGSGQVVRVSTGLTASSERVTFTSGYEFAVEEGFGAIEFSPN